MITKIIFWAMRFTPVLGTIEKDVEGAIETIESDKHLMGKVTAAVEGLMEVLQEVTKAMG